MKDHKAIAMFGVQLLSRATFSANVREMAAMPTFLAMITGIANGTLIVTEAKEKSDAKEAAEVRAANGGREHPTH